MGKIDLFGLPHDEVCGVYRCYISMCFLHEVHSAPVHSFVCFISATVEQIQ
jgi:hypothetical protein